MLNPPKVVKVVKGVKVVKVVKKYNFYIFYNFYSFYNFYNFYNFGGSKMSVFCKNDQNYTNCRGSAPLHPTTPPHHTATPHPTQPHHHPTLDPKRFDFSVVWNLTYQGAWACWCIGANLGTMRCDVLRSKIYHL